MLQPVSLYPRKGGQRIPSPRSQSTSKCLTRAVSQHHSPSLWESCSICNPCTLVSGSSALPGSLELLAPPDIAPHIWRTCGPFAALWPTALSFWDSSTLPQVSPPPSVTPGQSLALLSAWGGCRCHVISVPSLPRLSVDALGFPNYGYTSFECRLDVVGRVDTVAPPSFNSTVGC